MVPDEHMEGWYTDPFGRHEARWMSAGVPTKLVRDGDEESSDEPPDGAPTVTPTRIEAEPLRDGADFLRADDPEADVSLHHRLETVGQETQGARLWLQDGGGRDGH
jgi:hypothetical protein